jgi:hypothetical protein
MKPREVLTSERVLAALLRKGWSVPAAAAELQVTDIRVRKAINRDPLVRRLYDRYRKVGPKLGMV